MGNVLRATLLTDEQDAFLRQWGDGLGLETDADVLRAALRLAFGEAFPPDPAAHGGSRGKKAGVGDEVRLKADVRASDGRTIRAGTVGVVEDRNRHGPAVAFAWGVELVRDKELEIVSGDAVP